MSDAAILNLVLWLPVAGMALVWALPEEQPDRVRWATFWVMALQFVLTVWLYVRFDAADPSLQFATRLPWIPDWGVAYLIGLDGFNVLLVLLTAFLGPLVVAGSFTAITKDVKLFHAMLFLIQFAMLETFVTQNQILYYQIWKLMNVTIFLNIDI